MSEFVNPRIENCYMHPKKYACWRPDTKLLSSEENLIEEESKISEVIQERFKMVMNQDYKTDSIEGSGISLTPKLQSQKKNKMSQEAPLDFSVKTVVHNEHARHSEFSPSQTSTKDDGKMSHHADIPTNYPNIKKLTAVPIYNGKVTSSVPIYNGNSKYQRPKQRHTNGLTQEYSEHRQEIRSPTQDTPVFNGNSKEFSQFQNSNHRRQEMYDDSLDCDRLNPQVQSPRLSRENSPEARSCSNSILQNVLVRQSDERLAINGVTSHVSNSSPLTSSTMNFEGTMSSFLATNPVLSDTGSLVPTPGPIYPPSSMMANYALLNSFGYSTATMHEMNPFNNASMTSAPMDTKIFQTPGLCDKKSNKPMRPFKALTNELMYGLSTMGLMNNNGYFKDYFQGSLKETAEPPKNNSTPKKESSEAPANSTINSSPTSSDETEHKQDATGSGDSNCSYPDACGTVTETSESTSNGNNRKRSRTLPIEVKDEAYWERRRKNNQAAKRSRDARRQKEDLVAQQAWIFREHNKQLTIQIKTLDTQNRHLQIQNHSAMEQCRSLELQLRLANEKLAQTRCGKCGSRLRNDNSENTFRDSNA